MAGVEHFGTLRLRLRLSALQHAVFDGFQLFLEGPRLHLRSNSPQQELILSDGGHCVHTLAYKLKCMDDLAGLRAPHHFLVTILAPIFDLNPFHPIVVPSRPTRLRKQRQPRLPPGLPASPLLAFALTPTLTSTADVISTPTLRTCEPQFWTNSMLCGPQHGSWTFGPGVL
jgi:hypothetical protein